MAEVAPAAVGDVEAPEVVLLEEQTESADGKLKTEFAKRNPHLEKFIPDAIENAVGAILPKKWETKLERTAKHATMNFHKFKTEFDEGVGEIAGVLFRVAKYAATKFNIGDIVFGVFYLADFHNKQNAVDAVEGSPLEDPATVRWLVYCTDLAVMSYCPTKDKFAAAVNIAEDDVIIFKPQADQRRPAYTVCLDHANKNVVWGFRGTTDLADMLTDAAAACTPYLDGYAHWGMLCAARWFAENELQKVREVIDAHPGYKLLLVGHSLGAGTACLLAHWIHNVTEAKAIMEGVDVRAVGVATPAVLTADLAEGCSDYVTSVVLMHDLVPRFSIQNVFEMKAEMDDTKWGDILAERIKDWMVPDAIEKSETYQRLARHVSTKADAVFKRGIKLVVKFCLGVAQGAMKVATFCRCIKAPKTREQREAEAEAQLAADAEAEEGAGQHNLAGKARAMAAAAGKREKAAMDDKMTVAQAAMAVQDSVRQVPIEEVHAVYAPGRLIFIKRHDPEPKEGDDDDDEGLEEDEEENDGRSRVVLVVQGREEESMAEVEAAEKAARERRRKAKLRAKKEKAKKEKADKAKKGKGKGKEEEPEEEPFPGATFDLIDAAPGQRFKRIVLRETCLLDHLCNGYIQGLEYNLKKLQAPVAAPEQQNGGQQDGAGQGGSEQQPAAS